MRRSIRRLGVVVTNVVAKLKQNDKMSFRLQTTAGPLSPLTATRPAGLDRGAHDSARIGVTDVACSK